MRLSTFAGGLCFFLGEALCVLDANIGTLSGAIKFLVGTGHRRINGKREDGRFSLTNVPPGDYVVEAWHESLGAQTQHVTVKANKSPYATFSFASAK